MKKALNGIFLISLLFGVAAIGYAADNSQCWKNGWKKGWCDAKEQNMCMAPLAPLPPLAPLGRDDCESRFSDGYRKGFSEG